MKKIKKTLAVLLSAVLAVGSVPATVMAETGTKPADGTTSAQPFPSGTGGSANFRIPGLVTLDDGTLVASCDARWNHAGDACGLDTIVSYSTDNGATWNYTFANYLGDNGNQKALYSSAFIDPAIATDGEKVYMIADLFPGGYALNTAPNQPPVGETGFDADGNLRLSADNRSNYSYHLERGDEGSSYYVIVENASNTVVEGYEVDAYFNITGDDYEGNLFYSDSPYLVYPTDYLYLTTSDDGGATWSIPSLLNLKEPDEQTLLVGPGRGIVTSTGRIVFTAYEWTRLKGGDVASCCFYSDDGGVTWERGASVTSQSSEATVVEANGNLYMFTRHGGYYVSSDWGETWTSQNAQAISYNEGCQLSATTYSKKIDGKTAIILSAPSNTDSRAAGKLFVGLVQNDGSLSWDYEYSVNGSAYYAYSCVTELNDGSIGLLYESAGASITYTNIQISDIAEDAVVSNVWCKDEDGNIVSGIALKSKDSITLNVQGADSDAVFSASSSNEDLLNVSLEGNELTITSGTVESGLAQETITLTDGTNSLKLKVNITDVSAYEIVELRMGDTLTYTIDGSVDTSSLDTSIASVTADGTEMTIEGLAEGITSVTAGETEYFIVVKNDVADIQLEEGESVVIVGAAIQQAADESIVSIEKNVNQSPYEKVAGITEDGQYLIGSTTCVVTSDSTSTSPVGRGMKAVDFNKEDLSDYMWTITAVDDGYTIQSKDGSYLSFGEVASTGGCAVVLSSTPVTVSIVAGSSDGYGITNGTYYLNNFGNSNTQAAGWTDNNNDWYFYQTVDSLVITGLAEGRTTLAVSGTTYNITVGNPRPVEVEEALEDLSSEIDAVAYVLNQSATYTEESLKEFMEAYNTAKGILESEEDLTAEEIRTILDNLKASAQKLAVKTDDGGKETEPPATTDKTVTDNNTPITNPVPEQPTVKLPAVGSSYSTSTAAYKVTSSTSTGGTVTFVKPKKKTNKKFTVPATVKINGLTYKVTEIANAAFKANKKLTQVTIGANVTKIGKSAFASCAKLKKITIKSKVLKSVGKQAVKNVHKKCVIKVPKKKLAAYKKLFKGKGLKSTMTIK